MHPIIPNIRKLTAADVEDIDPILMAAYNRPSSFQSELQLYLTLQPDGWLIAECDGVPVGMVGAVDYGTFAYIGLLCVHPAFQRCGIGQLLMEKILAWLDERKSPNAVLDATEVGVPLYTKLGFVQEEKSLLLKQDSAVQHIGSFNFVSELRSPDLSDLTTFDTPIFGASRQAVFAAFLKEFPNRAFVARNQTGEIIGYLFAQPQRLGPWAASTMEAAEALLATALQLSFDDTPLVLVPGSNQTATALLRRYGFTQQRSLSHMRRGRSAVPDRRFLLYGMANFALG
jgi:ribosomal protein S18 acetylase RimI-like enzyme